MYIPQDIVSRWSEFVADCCLGIPPAEAPSEVARAFDVLRRYWPEYIDELQRQDTPGIGTIAPAIAQGLTIAACEQVRGFGPVMARLRGGEELALAELQFAEALVRSSLMPVLEPTLGSKTLDCSLDIGSDRVFVEVISPETAAGIRDAEAAIQRMAADLIECTKGTRTEILIGGELDERFDVILASAAAVPPDSAVHNIEGTV